MHQTRCPSDAGLTPCVLHHASNACPAALKAELSAAEQRMASEHRAHAGTRATAAARERELQLHLEDSSAAFAGAQRSLEESTARSRGGLGTTGLCKLRIKLAVHMRVEESTALSGGGLGTTGLRNKGLGRVGSLLSTCGWTGNRVSSISHAARENFIPQGMLQSMVPGPSPCFIILDKN